MKRIVFLLAILLTAAAAMQAQVPQVINYQGRAQVNNLPLQGVHTIDIRLYADSLDPAPVWAENHPNVVFTDGVFAVGIGSRSPKLPPFNRPYFIGVTIQGVNAGAELPRIQLRSTPYSLQADSAFYATASGSANSAKTADSAVKSGRAASALKADTATIAKSLAGPATISNAAGVKGTVLTVAGQGGGSALVVNGVDSTSQYYVAGGNLGAAGKPVAGGYYRDNAVVAWATISQSNVLGKFGIDSVRVTDVTPSGQGYEITLSATLPNTGIAVSVTPVAVDGILLVPAWALKAGTTNTVIVVKLYNMLAAGNPVPIPGTFSIVVFGRP